MKIKLRNEEMILLVIPLDSFAYKWRVLAYNRTDARLDSGKLFLPNQYQDHQLAVFCYPFGKRSLLSRTSANISKKFLRAFFEQRTGDHRHRLYVLLRTGNAVQKDLSNK